MHMINLQEIKKNMKSVETHKNQVAQQLRESNEKNKQLEGWWIPKLKDTRAKQKEIYEELEKIRQDASLLPSMFRAEAVFRKEMKNEKDAALNEKDGAMKQHNKLCKKVDDLHNELNRKERLSHQAIAARGNMKQYLDEAKSENERLDNEINELIAKLDQADVRVSEYKRKHDDMFDSVSGLNKRIDELEEHKIHLLEKLK